MSVEKEEEEDTFYEEKYDDYQPGQQAARVTDMAAVNRRASVGGKLLYGQTGCGVLSLHLASFAPCCVVFRPGPLVGHGQYRVGFLSL